MSRRDRIVLPGRQTRDLARENERLRRELEHKHRECHEVEDALANVLIERDAADELLGAAMDELLGQAR